MAGSRIHKIGTIFSRTTGLLRSGAMKEEDKPLWYDIYRAFPPKLEPRYERPFVSVEIKQIFYPEDEIRAQFYKAFGTPGAMNMSNEKQKSTSQRFVETYLALQQRGDIQEEDLFKAATDALRSEGVFLSNQKAESNTEEQTTKYSNETDLTIVIPASSSDKTIKLKS